MSSQIDAEKAKLPLAFLFERNLDRHYCRTQGVAVITKIFAKLQHRLACAALVRWRSFTEALRTLERKGAAFKRSQVQALALFTKLASDAYVGTLDRAFTRWRQCVDDAIAQERSRAATRIQTQFRQRRAKRLLRTLRLAALDKAFKRSAEVAQLLRFEAYGRAMQWSTLRNGFDLLLQNHCARTIQMLFRRFMLRQRVCRRKTQSCAAVAIQTAWRRVLARRELARRRETRRVRDALRAHAATTIQRYVRGLLAKREAAQRRAWLSNENQHALTIQTCWRHHCDRRALHRRFVERSALLAAARVRRQAIEWVCELARQLDERVAAARTLQRVFRGFQGRCVCSMKRRERDLELAARRVQTSWRRSKGRYVLQLRFSAQRERLDARREHAVRLLQCCIRVFLAKCRLHALRVDALRRQHAATTIQRMVRGRRERQQYIRKRRATVKIQGGMKVKLARRERQRRLDRKLEHYRQLTLAATTLQRWVRGVLARCLVARMRALEAREAELARSAALLIQKRARGIEARKTAQLLREAMALVEREQQRHFAGSQRAASPLLQFITDHYYLARTSGSSSTTESSVLFTHEQCMWLTDRITETRTQLAKEDAAVVFLQRLYRGYLARIDYVVKKLRAQQRRALETRMAVRIQRVGRGHIARRRMRTLQQRRKLEDLKAAYIRERKWKLDEQAWREQYAREQMELQVRKLHAMELELKQAKRDAELAAYHAQVAAYKKQELAAAQETHDNVDAVTSKDEQALADGWVELADEYGNAYFFNESTFESSWERPTKAPTASSDVLAAPAESAPESDKQELTAMKETASPLEPATTTDRDASSDQTASAESTASAAAVSDALDGKCCVCRTAVATKECLDCSDVAHRAFCAACFTREHFGLPGAGASKATHDFRVLVKVTKRAQCLAPTCLAADASANAAQSPKLASYYCSECVAPSPSPEATDAAAPSSPSVAPLPTSASTTAGCFYCESCFPQAHTSAQTLQHVPSAFHFRTGTTLCCDCSARVATRQCDGCDEAFCAPCYDRIHANSARKREHAWTALEIVKDELTSDKDAYCIECDVRRATQLCNLCGDGFCAACFADAHARGKKQQHTWIAWDRFAQVGDWLEVFDDTANATIYFNIETKESTTKQPFALKSGAERHALLFHEREALQKRKELELESEIVKLRDHVRALEEREALTQRPQSRHARTSQASGGDTARSSKLASGKQKEKPKRTGGLLHKLFGRSSNATPSDGLSLDERKRNELVQSISADEQALVLEKMKTRAREEKEAKAAATLGTKQFEAAMLQELAKS